MHLKFLTRWIQQLTCQQLDEWGGGGGGGRGRRFAGCISVGVMVVAFDEKVPQKYRKCRFVHGK